jgi:lipoate-protein ligase A
MLFVDNRGITDPRINLALEEYVFRTIRAGDSFLTFYINEPSIIIGRNQNTLEEINHEYVRDNGIHVVRRVSGGGAVYHDLGNLNFSIIAPYAKEKFNRYDEFTRPVVDVLRDLRVPAELSGRNDILVDGRKISGNAQFTSGDRMFSHGTVLFDSDLDRVTEALRPKMSKIESKGIKSVRSRVVNIADFLNEPIDIHEFRNRILERVFGSRTEVPTVELTDADWENVRALTAKKYGTWEWNFGESPKFNVQKTRRFPSGEVDLRIDVHRGAITGVRIFGDFIGQRDVGDIEERLRGVRYEQDDLVHALAEVDLADYFGGITREEFLELLYG